MKNIIYCFFFTLCFWGNVFLMAEENRQGTVIFFDNCRTLVPHRPYRGVWPLLEKRGISKDVANSVKVPKEWFINWHYMTSETRIGGSNEFFVSTPLEKAMMLYGPSINPQDSRFYLIEVAARMPESSRCKTSTLKIGIHRYGFLETAVPNPVSENFISGERKVVRFQIDLSNDFARFVPLVVVRGDIILEHMTIKKMPDNLSGNGLTVVEGTLTELSEIPDPKKLDYPNCRFVARFVGNSIISGAQCPKEFAAVLEGVSNYRYRDTKRLKSGHRVRMLVAHFDTLPAHKKTTQQVDDFELFTHENYYVFGVSVLLGNFNDPGGIPQSGIYFSTKEYVSIFEQLINSAIPIEVQKVQDGIIAADLLKIETRMHGYDKDKIIQINKNFNDVWQKEQSKDHDGRNRLAKWVWRKVDDSFWCLPSKYRLINSTRKLPANSIDAIVAFKDFLKIHGCQFILALIPNIYDISARVINKDFRNVPDLRLDTVAHQLLQHGIETISFSDELIKNYNRYPYAFFFPENEHPSDTCQDVLADVLTERLKRFNFSQQLDPEKFSFVKSRHVYENAKQYLWPKNCDIGNNTPSTAYQCRRVLYDGKDVKYTPDAPVLIVGNSFIQTPMSYPDSLPSLLMQKGHHNVTVIRFDGGSWAQFIPTICNNLKYYLENKKIVIIVLGIDHVLNFPHIPNVREIDKQQKMLGQRNMVAQFAVNGNFKSSQKWNWISSVASGRMSILHVANPKWDTKKRLLVAIPTRCDTAQHHARYRINGVDVNIPPFPNSHNLVTCELPAGTVSLDIELIAAPKSLLSVKNILIYQ